MNSINKIKLKKLKLKSIYSIFNQINKINKINNKNKYYLKRIIILANNSKIQRKLIDPIIKACYDKKLSYLRL